MTAPTYRPPINPAGYVTEQYYGQILDEFVADTPTDLLWPNSVPTYAAMRRDPTCAAVLDGWLLQLLRATWQLDGRGCDPTLTRQVADDMGLRVVGSDEAGAARVRGVSWEDHLSAALSSKLVFGHMGFALGAQMRDGVARLSVLAERLPQTITEIHADPKTGEFLGVSQAAGRRSGRPEILARNMAWYCHRREGANWAGTSMFRAAWMPFRIKKEMIRVHATSNQRWGAGVPVMEALPGTNPSPAEMAAAMQMAAAARSGENAGAASPPNFTMKIMGLTGAIPDTLAFIEWLDRQVSRASLMPHIELGQGTTGGSRALGTTFVDSFMLALETLATQTAMEATRQIAARLVEWNRGPDEPVPTVVVSGIGSKREVTAESLAKLLAAGALSADPALEAWVRREYRLPEQTQPTAVPTTNLAVSTTTGPADPTTGIPVTTGAPATGSQLVQQVIAHAAAADWSALDIDSDLLAQAEAGTTAPPPDQPIHWADENAVDNDWRIDAALARGAQVAEAYGSQDPDDETLRRGHDIATAEAQLSGGTAPSFDEFQAAADTAKAYQPTVQLDNRIVATAFRLGRHAAVMGEAVPACPYRAADAEQAALMRVWLTAYLRIRPATAATDATAQTDTLPAEPDGTERG